MKKIFIGILIITSVILIGFIVYNKIWNSTEIERLNFPITTPNFNKVGELGFYGQSEDTKFFEEVRGISYQYKEDSRPDPEKRCSYSEEVVVILYKCKNSLFFGNKNCLESVREKGEGINSQRVKISGMDVWKSYDPLWSDCSRTQGIENKYTTYIWAKGNIIYRINLGENTEELVKEIISKN